MKKALAMFALAAMFASCNFAGNSESKNDDTDSIDAAKSADSLLQNELNSDTSSKTDTTAVPKTQQTDTVAPTPN